MINKLKQWIVGKVIMSKVGGKLIKHATGAVVGFLFGPTLAPVLEPIFSAMEVTKDQVEIGLIVAFTGLFGAAWNYIEHRFIKK